MNDGFLPGALIGCVIGAGMTFMVMCIPLNNMRAEAVKRHAAEWVVDPATGSTTFKWKEVTEP
jgi:hypothetical protein